MFLKQYSSHFKVNFYLAYPVMLSQLGHVMVGVADSVMVGQLGAEPLAAASLANVIFHVLMTFGIGVSYAITPLVAAADGEGNIRKSAEVLRHGTLINFIIGIILVTMVFVGSRGLYFLDQPVVVVKYAIPYLVIITLSVIPLMFFQSARQFAEGLAHTRQAMYITVASNFLNIFLNYLLIFGKLGFPELGLIGAGIATLISRVIMGISMWIFILKSSRYTPYILEAKMVKWSNSIARKMLRIGLPAGFQFIFEVGAFGISSIMIGWLGAKSLAAHQIAINMASVSYMMATGLSAAATIRVGNQLGKNDIPTLRNVSFSIFIMVAVFMSFFALMFIFGRHYLPSLYISDNEVIGLATSLLVIAAFFQISDGVQVVGLGALRGMSDVKIPALITFIAYWIIGLPVGYVLGFKVGLGIQGIWYGLLTGLTVAAILLFLRFNLLTKKLITVSRSSK
jgi:MATE family multidrug resistance protein